MDLSQAEIEQLQKKQPPLKKLKKRPYLITFWSIGDFAVAILSIIIVYTLLATFFRDPTSNLSDGTKRTNPNANFNPKMEDISTVHRSVDLAQRFELELYGNLWTNAYIELAELKLEDGDINDILLKIFMTAFEDVRFVARNQLCRIVNELKKSNKTIEDIIQTGPIVIKDLFEIRAEDIDVNCKLTYPLPLSCSLQLHTYLNSVSEGLLEAWKGGSAWMVKGWNWGKAWMLDVLVESKTLAFHAWIDINALIWGADVDAKKDEAQRDSGMERGLESSCSGENSKEGEEQILGGDGDRRGAVEKMNINDFKTDEANGGMKTDDVIAQDLKSEDMTTEDKQADLKAANGKRADNKTSDDTTVDFNTADTNKAESKTADDRTADEKSPDDKTTEDKRADGGKKAEDKKAGKTAGKTAEDKQAADKIKEDKNADDKTKEDRKVDGMKANDKTTEVKEADNTADKTTKDKKAEDKTADKKEDKKTDDKKTEDKKAKDETEDKTSKGKPVSDKKTDFKVVDKRKANIETAADAKSASNKSSVEKTESAKREDKMLLEGGENPESGEKSEDKISGDNVSIRVKERPKVEKIFQESEKSDDGERLEDGQTTEGNIQLENGGNIAENSMIESKETDEDNPKSDDKEKPEEEDNLRIEDSCKIGNNYEKIDSKKLVDDELESAEEKYSTNEEESVDEEGLTDEREPRDKEESEDRDKLVDKEKRAEEEEYTDKEESEDKRKLVDKEKRAEEEESMDREESEDKHKLVDKEKRAEEEESTDREESEDKHKLVDKEKRAEEEESTDKEESEDKHKFVDKEKRAEEEESTDKEENSGREKPANKETPPLEILFNSTEDTGRPEYNHKRTVEDSEKREGATNEKPEILSTHQRDSTGVLGIDPMERYLIRRLQKNVDIDGLKTLMDRAVEKWEYSNQPIRRKDVERYIRACVEIAWRMNALEPPMFATMDDLIGLKFDKSKHVSQSGTGDIISRVVWPALYLYENGTADRNGPQRGPFLKRPIVILETEVS